ncbi:hypothetical protein IQ229_07275 [Nostoc cf. edaphicum LEGE 07299]|uniref:DUF6888 domain-containing protein n=1 Tax=Nostoc cf. edaphicum LEGE 07299 TaxID=2777974 RepID=A0ABR9TWG8_9NOSO|nr:hypothetical protein [Nostoc cf. edaphicum LEGE 07299]ODG97579.1 hypothetical protein A4S05_12825 [Nostoc sp. KVJ20]
MLPTTEQALACVRVCQMLSNLYKDIRLFRFDDTTGQVYILAGDELQVIVLSNGIWDFVNEPEL